MAQGHGGKTGEEILVWRESEWTKNERCEAEAAGDFIWVIADGFA